LFEDFVTHGVYFMSRHVPNLYLSSCFERVMEEVVKVKVTFV